MGRRKGIDKERKMISRNERDLLDDLKSGLELRWDLARMLKQTAEARRNTIAKMNDPEIKQILLEGAARLDNFYERLVCLDREYLRAE